MTPFPPDPTYGHEPLAVIHVSLPHLFPHPIFLHSTRMMVLHRKTIKGSHDSDTSKAGQGLTPFATASAARSLSRLGCTQIFFSTVMAARGELVLFSTSFTPWVFRNACSTRRCSKGSFAAALSAVCGREGQHADCWLLEGGHKWGDWGPILNKSQNRMPTPPHPNHPYFPD